MVVGSFAQVEEGEFVGFRRLNADLESSCYPRSTLVRLSFGLFRSDIIVPHIRDLPRTVCTSPSQPNPRARRVAGCQQRSTPSRRSPNRTAIMREPTASCLYYLHLSMGADGRNVEGFNAQLYEQGLRCALPANDSVMRADARGTFGRHHA